MNKVILIGRLGKDPEVRYTSTGKAVANFSLATNEGKDRTTWHNIVVWEKQAELAGEYLSKGRQVAIEGSIQNRKWEDKEGNPRQTTEIVAHRVEFLGSKADGQGSIPGGGGSGRGSAGASPVDDDDIPF